MEYHHLTVIVSEFLQECYIFLEKFIINYKYYL